MPKFKVTVEKRMYSSGVVEVVADNEDEAVDIIRQKIETYKLHIDDIDWNEPTYEDGTFEATEDVEDMEESEESE